MAEMGESSVPEKVLCYLHVPHKIGREVMENHSRADKPQKNTTFRITCCPYLGFSNLFLAKVLWFSCYSDRIY